MNEFKSKKANEKMNKECSECQGKCCVGVIEVFPEDEIYNDLTLTKSYIQADYDRVMITDKEHKCIALINGTCSIYDKRPQICRAFKVNSECCIKFRNGELKSHTCEKCCLIVSRNIHIQNQMNTDEKLDLAINQSSQQKKKLDIAIAALEVIRKEGIKNHGAYIKAAEMALKQINDIL